MVALTFSEAPAVSAKTSAAAKAASAAELQAPRKTFLARFLDAMMEARLNGRPPVAVKNYADNQDLAFRGAAEKLVHAVEHVFGKLDRKEHRERDTIRRDPEVLS